jgi:hypothetical protein
MGRFQFSSGQMFSMIAWFAIALALLAFRLRQRHHYLIVGPVDLLVVIAVVCGAIVALAGNASRGALLALACGLFFLLVLGILMIYFFPLLR